MDECLTYLESLSFTRLEKVFNMKINDGNIVLWPSVGLEQTFKGELSQFNKDKERQSILKESPKTSG